MLYESVYTLDYDNNMLNNLKNEMKLKVNYIRADNVRSSLTLNAALVDLYFIVQKDQADGLTLPEFLSFQNQAYVKTEQARTFTHYVENAIMNSASFCILRLRENAAKSDIV